MIIILAERLLVCLSAGRLYYPDLKFSRDERGEAAIVDAKKFVGSRIK